MSKRVKKPWKGKLSLQENLRAAAPAMVADYFEAGRQALSPGKSWDEIHQFRLATKRFRYTLEILRPAYRRGIEPIIESLRRLQTLLGDVNDCVATSEMLMSLPDTEELRRSLDERANARSEKLRAYWRRQFDAPGNCDHWRRYMQSGACRSKTRVARSVQSQPEAAPGTGT